MAGGDDVEVITDDRRDVDGHVIRIRVLSVPKSDKFPEGIKYAFHYSRKGADAPILRYDNHHGVHERHAGDDLEEIDFPGLEPLFRRFKREVDYDVPE